MKKYSTTLIFLLSFNSVCTAESNFYYNSAHSYCNRAFYFSGAPLSVYEKPNSASKEITVIIPSAGKEIKYKRYNSISVTTQTGTGQFIKKPDLMSSSYYGTVNFIDFSKLSHLPLKTKPKLIKGAKFEYLAMVEEGSGLIRIENEVYLTQLSMAKITKKPTNEWWVKLESIEQGWVNLSNHKYSMSKCKW